MPSSPGKSLATRAGFAAEAGIERLDNSAGRACRKASTCARVLFGEDRTRRVQQRSAGREHRPRRVEQARLDVATADRCRSRGDAAARRAGGARCRWPNTVRRAGSRRRARRPTTCRVRRHRRRAARVRADAQARMRFVHAAQALRIDVEREQAAASDRVRAGARTCRPAPRTHRARAHPSPATAHRRRTARCRPAPRPGLRRNRAVRSPATGVASTRASAGDAGIVRFDAGVLQSSRGTPRGRSRVRFTRSHIGAGIALAGEDVCRRIAANRAARACAAMPATSARGATSGNPSRNARRSRALTMPGLVRAAHARAWPRPSRRRPHARAGPFRSARSRHTAACAARRRARPAVSRSRPSTPRRTCACPRIAVKHDGFEQRAVARVAHGRQALREFGLERTLPLQHHAQRLRWPRCAARRRVQASCAASRRSRRALR